MSRLLLHVGYAKCASTSLQSALAEAAGLHYPAAGRIGAEHIALPLALKGIDPWTRRFVEPDWVERELAALRAEVAAADGTVAVSSERLIDLDDGLKPRLAALFPGRGIEVVVIRRPVGDLLRSTWCHLVVHHDLAEAWEDYSTRHAGFDLDAPVASWRQHYPVHEIDMAEAGWAGRLGEIFGTAIAIGHENRGAGMAPAVRLQQIHADLGSERFARFFTPERKRAFLELYAEAGTG